MSYRNNTYIAFDSDTDMQYYRTLQMWSENNHIDFDFYDAHDLNTARDSSQIESIEKQLRVRFDNSKVFMIIVGDATKNNRKFIPWEIEQAIKRDLPIIVTYVNGSREIDYTKCPVPLRNELAIHIPFKAKIIQYAFDNWPAQHVQYRRENHSSPYHYMDSVYRNLSL